MQIVNGIVGWKEELSAGNAIDALKSSLALKSTVKRNREFKQITATELVPGDLIMIKIGDIIPADCVIIHGGTMDCDESGLTGESLPVTKNEKESMFQGAVAKRGEVEAIVTKTGEKTLAGKAGKLILSVEKRSNFKKILLIITFSLLIISVILVIIAFIRLMLKKNPSFLNNILLCVILLIASIPIAMQVVATSTMAVGAHKLAGKKAIVSRLAAIEELAGMNMLCSDKTGTLTLNKLTIKRDTSVTFNKYTYMDLIENSMLCCKVSDVGLDAIDTCIKNEYNKVVKDNRPLQEYEEVQFVPFDPMIRRTESTL